MNTNSGNNKKILGIDLFLLQLLRMPSQNRGSSHTPGKNYTGYVLYSVYVMQNNTICPRSSFPFYILYSNLLYIVGNYFFDRQNGHSGGRLRKNEK